MSCARRVGEGACAASVTAKAKTTPTSACDEKAGRSRRSPGFDQLSVAWIVGRFPSPGDDMRPKPDRPERNGDCHGASAPAGTILLPERRSGEAGRRRANPEGPDGVDPAGPPSRALGHPRGRHGR